MKLSDIEDGIMFVSSGMYGENSAMLCKSTGEICWSSDSSDIHDIPEEAYESDDWIDIPHCNDLDLGRDLVFRFVAQHLPSEEERIRNIFGRRGAYSQYKDFLEKKGRLQDWYDYENEHTLKAIKEWCQDKEIEIGV
ncbi:MAG: hypothetical protein D3923_00535 [Candidatus Electrothrix sp. AR3]|nr:hypothetical protein [Candidatus Electrothrix sp. AR3]